MAAEAPAPARCERRRRRFQRWLQRAVTPFKPMLRPLARKVGLSPRLDAQAEKILLAQIEDFQPDLVLNQDIFPRRPRPDAPHQGHRQSHPGRTGRNRAIARRGLVGLRSDDVATVGNGGFLPPRSACARKSTIWRSSPPFSMPCRRRRRMDIDVSFVGTVSPDHRQRIALLEAVARRYDLKLFGSRPQALPASSPLHRCFQGEVWGADMYQALRRSKHHAQFAHRHGRATKPETCGCSKPPASAPSC